MAYHRGQPFNDNMLRPCPMLENPDKLREMVVIGHEDGGAQHVQKAHVADIRTEAGTEGHKLAV